MRLILDKILWGTLIILFGPTVMIVTSWNALPGDNLYGVKLALEKAALALASPSYATSGNLQIKYTERRFAEAKQLMASKQSIQGLPYLDQQIVETKRMIDAAPNKEAQIALAKQYISTLSTVSTDLEIQKQAITSNPQPLSTTSKPSNQPNVPTDNQAVSLQLTPTTAATNTPAPKPTNTPTPVPPTISIRTNDGASPAPRAATNTPTQTPTPTATPTNTPVPAQKSQIAVATPISTGQAVVALQINQTQQDVSRTIADLQAIVEQDDKEQNKKREKQIKEEKEKKDEKDRKDKKDREDNSQ